MANNNHLFSVPCYNGTMLKQDYYNDFFDIGQQKINFSFFELSLPDDDSVYTLKKVMLKRQTRSIQTEGHFGDIKENEDFRRFNYRSAENVYKEFMLYAIGRNIMKYHRFLHHEIEKYEGKKEHFLKSKQGESAP